MWLPRGMERTLVQPCEWLGSRLLPTDWASSGLSLLMSKGEIWAFYHVVCMRDRSGKGKWQLLSFQKSNMRKGSHPVRLHSRRGPRQSELTSLTSSAHMLCGLALRPLGCMQPGNRSQTYLYLYQNYPLYPVGDRDCAVKGNQRIHQIWLKTLPMPAAKPVVWKGSYCLLGRLCLSLK